VFVFHGGGSAGSLMREAFTLEAAAQGQAVFVYPDGLGYIWDLKNDGPDAKLFDSMVATLQDAWCVDKNSIFAVGFSYGGWAATQMAKARPTVVRAIASIAGGGPAGGVGSDAPVAAMLVHGMNDTAEPPDAGEGSRDHFVATNGCAATSQPVDPSPCQAYTGCMAGKPVQWCLHPGVHEIPGFVPPAIWNFFSSLR
jgi:poly(3-hydroxybutyrate) depolymerase